MKKLLTLFMCLALVGLSSCSSDDDDNDGGGTGKVKLTATFKYMKDGAAVVSPLTTMYIYDTKNEDTSAWEYNSTSHNMERTDGTVVYPKYTFLSSENGTLSEEIDNKIVYLYVAVAGVDPSQTYKDKFETKSSAIKIEKTLTKN